MNISCSTNELLLILSAIDSYVSDLKKYKDEIDSGNSNCNDICKDVQSLEELKKRFDDILNSNDSNPMNY
jgi:hypothetical protein